MSFLMPNSSDELHIISDEDERTLIDEIDTNGYLVDEEDEMEPTNVFDQSMRYSVLGKTFENLDVAYDFYNGYGLSKGFGIRKSQVNRRKKTNEIYRKIFVCNKQGFKDVNDKRHIGDDVKRRCIVRTGCEAMMQVTLSEHGEWVVDKFISEHNHPLDPPSHVLKQRSHSIFHRSHECKDVVTLLSKAGIRPSEITKIVNAFRGNDEDKLTRMQCSNIVSNEMKFNLGKECHGIIMHFKQRAQLDKEFYFDMDLSKDGTLKSVFWADGRSRYSYCQFGDVLVFDTTYRTNKFSFPFALFVGVNHHGQSILFGGALLENETETTFTWLFKQFLKCMNGSPPISIITDQDLAMGNAIAKVFPKTRHRFCAWHIQKHVLEHLQPLRSRYDDFQDTYNQWVRTPNVEDFESKWEHIKEKYLISEKSWLGNMYNLRQYWVKAYLNDTFFAGMTTSGRSESMHSFFDGFVNSKTMLNDFVQQYDKAVSSRRAAEKDQDFRTLNSKPTLQGDHPIEVMAAKCYTRNLYDVFKKEWKASFDCGHKKITKDSCVVQYRVGFLQGNIENWKVVECKVGLEFFATCSCAKFETFGILCKHILYIMRRKLLTVIPNHYILPRWTMKAIDLVGNIGTECRGTKANVNEELSLLTLWSIRTKFTKILENGKDYPLEIKKLDDILNGILEEQNMRKKARVEFDTNDSPGLKSGTQVEESQPEVLVSDPIVPVSTKGRPKVDTRIKPGMETSMNTKKQRTCSYCRGIGHYVTVCKIKKFNES